MITFSWQVRFVMVQFIPHRTAKEQANMIKNVIKLYARAGLMCQMALVDKAFEKV